ncbi:MAG: right-handed parallel beta-helix repeat-containing protein [Candidatus Hatepunaea meridiana]|nr:right-handed parallel beta-helix repeat-containing protein [Candidatus Hatepunaea meridiana]
MAIIVLFSHLSFAQPLFIRTDDVFHGHIDLFNGGDHCVLNNRNPVGVDYVFGVNGGLEPGDDVFHVNFEQLLEIDNIEGDVEIQLWTNVVLDIDGAIIAEGASFNTHPNGAPWGSILIKGNAVGFQINAENYINGDATFNDCNFSNGGSGGLAQIYFGEITLSNYTEDEDVATPVLSMSNCNLVQSQSNGILVHDFERDDDEFDPFIHLENTNILTAIANGKLYEANIPHGNAGIILDIDESSEIQFCGNNGIIHEGLPIHPGAFIINIDDSFIRECNNHRITINGAGSRLFNLGLNISSTEITNNGNEAGFLGVGVFVTNIRSPGSSINILSGCTINNNDQAGIKLDQVVCTNRIKDSFIFNNGEWALQGDLLFEWGAGIRVKMLTLGPCPPDIALLVVEGCEIHHNGHEGVCISLESGNPLVVEQGTTIIGNHIYNNATGIAIVGDVDFEAREGAGIHILGDVHYPTITNNIIDGGISGICWDGFDREEPPNGPPLQGRVRNNIQSDAQYGLYIWRHSPARIEPWEFGDVEYFSPNYSTHFYNNVFWNNELAGCYVGNLAEPMFDEQMQCNIFGSDDFPDADGIDYNAGAIPEFAFNGFCNNDDNGWGGDDPNGTVDADPLFVDGFHLYWNSPMINRGRNEDPQDARLLNAFMDPYVIKDAPMVIGELLRDRSRNDIGAYGGALANGMDGIIMTDPPPGIAEIDDYGFDPYCKIDAGNCHLSNAGLNADFNFNSLEWDYYRAYSNFFVDNNAALDIDPRCYFEIQKDRYFRIQGTVIANIENVPEDDPWVYFSLFDDPDDPGGHWHCIVMNGVGAIDSRFYKCDINEARTGIEIDYVFDEDPGNEVDIKDCYIHDIESIGISILKSRVQIHGNWDPDDEENQLYDNQNMVTRVGRDNPFLSSERGIWMFMCPDGVDPWVVVEETRVIECGPPDPEDVLSCGVGLGLSDPALLDMMIFHSGVTGITMFTSNPDLNANMDVANDIKENGNDLEGQGQEGEELWNGAEIALMGSSTPIISFCDIQDHEPPTQPEGYTIYLNPDPLIEEDVHAEESYWGATQAAVEEHPENFFYCDGDDEIFYDDAYDNEIDDVGFRDGLDLFRHGETRAAMRIFISVIASSPNTSDAVTAARYLIYCYNELELDFDDLRSYFNTISRIHRREGIARTARLMIPYTYMFEDRIEDALRGYNDLALNADNAADSLEARFIYLQLDHNLNGDRANSAVFGEEQVEIDRTFNLLIRSGRDEWKAEPPSEFALHAAYPNPFNSTTCISYSLDRDAFITLKLFDTTGREIATLANESQSAGHYQTVWNAEGIPSGVYLLRLNADGDERTTKLALIR